MSKQGAHIIINNTHGEAVLLNNFPCHDCDTKTRTKTRYNEVSQNPVLHGIQFGKCPQCGAAHFIVNARTDLDCETLVPVARKFAETFDKKIH